MRQVVRTVGGEGCYFDLVSQERTLHLRVHTKDCGLTPEEAGWGGGGTYTTEGRGGHGAGCRGGHS